MCRDVSPRAASFDVDDIVVGHAELKRPYVDRRAASFDVGYWALAQRYKNIAYMEEYGRGANRSLSRSQHDRVPKERATFFRFIEDFLRKKPGNVLYDGLSKKRPVFK